MAADLLLFTGDEADVVVANVDQSRRLWLEVFQGAVIGGRQDRADHYLDCVLDFDRMIAKVRGLTRSENDGSPQDA